MNGEGGTDTLNLGLYTSGVTVDLSTGSASPINLGTANQISNVENIIGGKRGRHADW